MFVLTFADVDRLAASFTPEKLQSLMAVVFARFSSSEGVFAPHRTAIPTANHSVLFMPAGVAGLGTALKIVSVPSSPSDKRGLPASTFVLDEDTGAVKAVVNARSLTALRNAAGSLLAARLIGPPEPRALVAFGAGKQVDAHVDLLLRAYPTLNTVTLINRTEPRLKALLQSLRSRHSKFSFTALVSPGLAPPSEVENAVRSADLIITATSSTSPLFPSSWVRPGAHLTLIGSYRPAMHEVEVALVHRAGLGGGLVVDSRAACAQEAGELIDAGVLPEEMVELGELVRLTGQSGETWEPQHERCAAVRRKGDVTIFKSVGLGLQDVAIATAIVKLAEEQSVGTRIPVYDL